MLFAPISKTSLPPISNPCSTNFSTSAIPLSPLWPPTSACQRFPCRLGFYNAYQQLLKFSTKEIIRLNSLFQPGHDASVSSTKTKDDADEFWSDDNGPGQTRIVSFDYEISFYMKSAMFQLYRFVNVIIVKYLLFEKEIVKLSIITLKIGKCNLLLITIY